MKREIRTGLTRKTGNTDRNLAVRERFTAGHINQAGDAKKFSEGEVVVTSVVSRTCVCAADSVAAQQNTIRRWINFSWNGMAVQHPRDGGQIQL
ncbi:hypothetical protein ACERZ8_04470 [Tateyamaria armeniaca]|uniref:Uncharacterized protein n=1 Tax=Tateyamaria armeniaca TaxID=2518930 RepID=A0ABW8UQF1_9RHOB